MKALPAAYGQPLQLREDRGVWIYAKSGHGMPDPCGKKSWTSHNAFLKLQEVHGVVDQDRAEDAFGFA
jgi:hypothetical protein